MGSCPRCGSWGCGWSRGLRPGCPCGWASFWPYRFKMASNAGRAGGSRCVRRLGRAGPHRGTSSQTAWCGVSRFKAAVCAVCCGGTPTRPRPSVSSASSRRWEEKRQAVAHCSLWRPEAMTVVTVERPCIGDGLFPPSGGWPRTRPWGGVVSGCPRSKLHTRQPCSNSPRTMQFVRRCPGAAPPHPRAGGTANPYSPAGV